MREVLIKDDVEQNDKMSFLQYYFSCGIVSVSGLRNSLFKALFCQSNLSNTATANLEGLQMLFIWLLIM